MRKKLIGQSFFCVIGEGIYILLVALVMKNANYLFGNNPGVLPIIAFLMLFVVSAAISGALILGKPILLYLDGKKREALELFGFTVGWILLFLIILLIAVIVLR